MHSEINVQSLSKHGPLSTVIDLSIPRSRALLIPTPLDTWIPKINCAHGDGIIATLQFARVVADARGCLKNGLWTALCSSGKVPFRLRQGQMLVRIGQTLVDLDAQTSARLPSGWTILYQLTRLQRTTLQRVIATGALNPSLTETAAKELVARENGDKAKTPRKPSIGGWLKKNHAFIESTIGEWAGAERDQVAAGLAELLDLVKSGPGGFSLLKAAACQSLAGGRDVGLSAQIHEKSPAAEFTFAAAAHQPKTFIGDNRTSTAHAIN